MKKVKNGKAVGHDKIATETLKRGWYQTALENLEQGMK